MRIMDRTKNKYYIILGALVSMIIGACSSSSTIQTGSYKYLYDYESRSLHPEYVLYHFSDDSSTVYFRIHSEELLYARSTAQSPFTSKLNLSCKMTSDTASDTMSVQIKDVQKEKPGWLIGSFNIKMPQGSWNIMIEFTDLVRNMTHTNYLVTDKTNTYTTHNYLARNATNDEPIFGGTTNTGSTITIESHRNRDKTTASIFRLDSEGKLPPPPFSPNNPETPVVTSLTSEKISPDSLGKYFITAEEKNYFFTHDELPKGGILIRTTSIDFPAVKQAKSLEWPLRYITTKTEYEQIVKSTYPKKMIDNFWIECGGNKNHAKDLIQIYYSRVEEANYYFSSYTDGWKTDRGMIHLIFGNPSKINKFSDREVWQYGEDNTTNQLIFVFNKEASPLSNNVYTLNRDPAFKQYWERMVTVWRTGRIYND